MKITAASLAQAQRIRDLALDLADELAPFKQDDTNVATEVQNLAFLIEGFDKVIAEKEVDF